MLTGGDLVLVSAIIIWLNCLIRGFFWPRYKKVGIILTLSTVYGLLPMWIAWAIYHAL
jgi:uncharacterized membrane protein YqjE